MSAFFAHVIFEKALINLYEKQQVHSDMPWSELIISFNNTIRTCVKEGEFINLSNSITGNSYDYPFSLFLRTEIDNIVNYTREEREIIFKYSKPLAEQQYEIDDWADFFLLSLRLHYLLLTTYSQLDQSTFSHVINPCPWNISQNFSCQWSELKTFLKTFETDKIQSIFRYLEALNIHTNFEEPLKVPIKRPRLDLSQFKYKPKPTPKPKPQPQPVKTELSHTCVPRPVKTNLDHTYVPQRQAEIKRKPTEEVLNLQSLSLSDKKISKKKVKIPSAVRSIVWKTYIGEDKASGKCLVCNFETITLTNFECGHIHAECQGGETTISNLRPICSHCNKSIGGQNMEDFMLRYGIKKFDNWDGV